MKHKSIWEDYSKEKKVKDNIKFNQINTDILIIGGGITGINTAYFFKDSNKKIIIIDKSTIGKGVTSKTTAKINYLQKDIYQKLKKMYGIKTSKLYFDSQKEAINLLIKIIKDNNINCDLEKVSSIIFSNKNIKNIKKEKEILKSWNVKVDDYKDNNIEYGIKVEDTYTFNPLKYLYSIKEIIKNKVNIYENITALSIEKKDNKYLVMTNKGIINAKYIVIACHYPFFVIPLFFPLKTYIEREYVNSGISRNKNNITMINIDKDLYSIRYYKDYLIYTSNNQKLTNSINYQKKYQKSVKDYRKFFKNNSLYSWMNQDIMSNDKLPIIGKIKDNLYISTAYNAWGMTNSVIGAKIISDLIEEKGNNYVNLFNPNRINIYLIFNGIISLLNYLKVYIEGLFHKSNPYYVKIKGVTYGIYIDKKKIKHIVKLFCPHMKCPLVFNKEEETWDCPCHGSRFDIDGNLLEGPATKNLTFFQK